MISFLSTILNIKNLNIKFMNKDLIKNLSSEQIIHTNKHYTLKKLVMNSNSDVVYNIIKKLKLYLFWLDPCIF